MLLAGLCVVAGQAQAGLFTDEEAHQKIQLLEARISKLETRLEETSRQQSETARQQTQSMLDLQTQIEALNTELRKLRGQNEELVHNLQDTEKRQKDFYVDLDTRVRHLETVEPPVDAGDMQPASGEAADDPAVENRAYERAYKLFKTEGKQKAIVALQEFLKKFPESVYAPNVYYLTGSAYFNLQDYNNALASYRVLLNKYAFSPRLPDAMFGIADCYQELKDKATTAKVLKQIIAKYPGSKMADKARKRLVALK